MEIQIDGRITVKAGSRGRREPRKKEQRCDKVRAKKGRHWDRVGVHRGRNGRIRSREFLTTGQRRFAKKDRPNGAQKSAIISQKGSDERGTNCFLVRKQCRQISRRT